MSRSLWFAAGAGAGLYAAVRARRVAEVFTVEGLQDRVGAAVVGLRLFRDEVAQGKADAESQLRERVGLALDGRAEQRELAAPHPSPPAYTNDEQEAGSS
ncbi:MAG: hypothetical protein JWN84_3318 [Nocardioides sp.]|nr:hypothetical protein [Nocardioides sp.]